MIRRKLKEAEFDPGILGVFTNPFYFARKGLVQNLRSLAPNVKGRTLDVGCGRMPYRRIFPATEYVGLELDSPSVRSLGIADYFYDGESFPFSDQQFDSVLAFQVLEHVFEPKEFLAEIQRVLKPGGILLLAVPFAWDEHEQPRDYGRYSSFGVAHLLENQGFEIITQLKSAPGIRSLFQLLASYLQKAIWGRNPYWNLAATIALIAPFNLLGVLAGALLPENHDFYLDNVVLAKKEKP